MPKYGGKQTPAGGSGNSNDLHGKADPKPDSGAPWPPGTSSEGGITSTARQTGSNPSGHSSAH
jgi:hypothetical protein